MSLNRYAVRRDKAERPIIEALEQRDWHVWQLDRPCDLLVWKPSLGPGVFRSLEVKSRKRNDQPEQQKFVATTGTPVVATPLEALRALGEIT